MTLGNFTPHCGGGENVSLEDKGVTMATTQLWKKQGKRGAAAKEGRVVKRQATKRSYLGNRYIYRRKRAADSCLVRVVCPRDTVTPGHSKPKRLGW